MFVLSLIETSEVLKSFKSEDGKSYFVPNGYFPILIKRSTEFSEEAIEKYQHHVPIQVTCESDNLLAPKLVLTSLNSKFKVRNSKGAKCMSRPKISRPLNAFLLYKQDVLVIYGHTLKQLPFGDRSKEIGRMWKNENEQTKKKYFMLAEKTKELHRLQYPDYKYRPRPSKLHNIS